MKATHFSEANLSCSVFPQERMLVRASSASNCCRFVESDSLKTINDGQ